MGSQAEIHTIRGHELPDTLVGSVSQGRPSHLLTFWFSILGPVEVPGFTFWVLWASSTLALGLMRRPFGHGSKPMGSHFGVGEFTHFCTYFSGWIESDGFNWGCGLGILPHGHLSAERPGAAPGPPGGARQAAGGGAGAADSAERGAAAAAVAQGPAGCVQSTGTAEAPERAPRTEVESVSPFLFIIYLYIF